MWTMTCKPTRQWFATEDGKTVFFENKIGLWVYSLFVVAGGGDEIFLNVNIFTD
jgi:hypothetical protein